MRVRPHQQTSALVLIKAAEEKPSSRSDWQCIIHKYLMRSHQLEELHARRADKVTQHMFISVENHFLT